MMAQQIASSRPSGAIMNRSQRLRDAMFAKALRANGAVAIQTATCTEVVLPTDPKSPPRARMTYKAARNSRADVALAMRNLEGPIRQTVKMLGGRSTRV